MQDAVRNRTVVYFLMIKLKRSLVSRVFKRIKRQTNSKGRLYPSSKGMPHVRFAVPCLNKAGLKLMDFYLLKAHSLAPGE